MFSTMAGKPSADFEMEPRKHDLDLDVIEGEAALAWVKEQNDEIKAVFSCSDDFKQMEKIALDLFERKDKIHSFLKAPSFSLSTGLTNVQKISLIEKLETLSDHHGWKVSKQHVAWIQCTDSALAEALALQLSRTEAATIKVSRRADKTAYVVQCQIVHFAQLLKDYSLLAEQMNIRKHNPSLAYFYGSGDVM